MISWDLQESRALGNGVVLTNLAAEVGLRLAPALATYKASLDAKSRRVSQDQQLASDA